jgi:hypothetical protein
VIVKSRLCQDHRTFTIPFGTGPELINPEIGCSSLDQQYLGISLVDITAINPVFLESDVAALYQDDCGNEVSAELTSIIPSELNTDEYWSFVYVFTITDACSLTTTCQVVYSGGLLSLDGLIVDDEECYGSEGIIVINNLQVLATDGDLTLVAGQSITLLPGIVVESGARLHAYISDEPYCLQPAAIVASEAIETLQTEDASSFSGNEPFFKVYPNPTIGIFNLELFDSETHSSSVKVEIYSLMGNKLIHSEKVDQNVIEFDLTNYPRGIYIVRVLYGDKLGVERVIRQ